MTDHEQVRVVAGIPDRVSVLELYESVGRAAYTRDPDSLMRGLENSTFVCAAYICERLVGLVRGLSDGQTICYVQDVLVRPDVQRTGVGRALMDEVMSRYGALRQLVLMTDDEPGQAAFYFMYAVRHLWTGASSDRLPDSRRPPATTAQNIRTGAPGPIARAGSRPPHPAAAPTPAIRRHCRLSYPTG